VTKASGQAVLRTSISNLLPVRIEREEREETPVVALLVILDRSGSMSAPRVARPKSPSPTKAQPGPRRLAAEGSLWTFRGGHAGPEVLPLSRISDKQSASKRIAGITAGGGGIYIYTSLAEALPRCRRQAKSSTSSSFRTPPTRGKVLRRARHQQGGHGKFQF
jgi:hypothetical protein